MTCSVPLEGRDEWEQSREIKLATRSRSYGAPTTLGAVSDFNERDRQCRNTSGGSDTTHPAARSS